MNKDRFNVRFKCLSIRRAVSGQNWWIWLYNTSGLQHLTKNLTGGEIWPNVKSRVVRFEKYEFPCCHSFTAWQGNFDHFSKPSIRVSSTKSIDLPLEQCEVLISSHVSYFTLTFCKRPPSGNTCPCDLGKILLTVSFLSVSIIFEANVVGGDNQNHIFVHLVSKRKSSSNDLLIET